MPVSGAICETKNTSVPVHTHAFCIVYARNSSTGHLSPRLRLLSPGLYTSNAGAIATVVASPHSLEQGKLSWKPRGNNVSASGVQFSFFLSIDVIVNVRRHNPSLPGTVILARLCYGDDDNGQAAKSVCCAKTDLITSTFYLMHTLQDKWLGRGYRSRRSHSFFPRFPFLPPRPVFPPRHKI